MTRTRNYIYLENESESGLSWQRLEQYMNDNGINSRGEALESIFNQYMDYKKQAADQETLAKEIAKEIKPQLDPIRIRTGYVDKNVRVLLNLVNAYILVNGLENDIPVTDIVTTPVRKTQTQVSDQIHAFQVANKERSERKKALADGE